MCLSVCPHREGYLPWMGGTYLGWGDGVPTLDGGVPTLDEGEGVPTLDGGRGYLPWTGEGVPTLDGGRGTYLVQGERGYLPWTGYAAGGTPLAASRRRIFLFKINWQIIEVNNLGTLTVPGHADSDAFLETTVLTAVAVDPHDVALLILQTWTVLNLLLNTSSEKPLSKCKRKTNDFSDHCWPYTFNY